MGVFADDEGRIAGIETDALIDGGAFASFGHVTTYYNGVLHTAPYEIGAFNYTGARVWTNKPASGAMRGHGAVNSRCAVEVGIDAVSGANECRSNDIQTSQFIATTQSNHYWIQSYQHRDESV